MHFMIALTGTLIIFTITNGLAQVARVPQLARPGLIVASCVAFAFAFLASLEGTILHLHALFALGVGVAGLVCVCSTPTPRRFFIGSLGAAALAYAVVITRGVIPDLREWQQYRERYPMESMSVRLGYERAHAVSAVSSTTTESALQERESAFEAYAWEIQGAVAEREERLRYLHSSTVRHFVNSPGFGVARLLETPNEYVLDQDALKDSIPLASLRPDDVEIKALTPPVKSASDSLSQLAPASDDLRGFHHSGFANFLDPLRFGLIEDRDHVAGFISHRFYRGPSLPLEKERDHWFIQNLQLVSLLKHDPPAAYLSENLPRMDELRDAKTRPLDAFEEQALAALRGGEDVTMQEGPDRIRMLGSIRALKQCVKCHAVERGELLGAFSYELRRGR
jgi:hypothetical protein